MTDQELLRQVVEDKSDAAFEALLGRHLGMIHGVCVRVLGAGHPGLADAVQGVSLLLYRKVGRLVHHPNLGGWLHRAATFTAIRIRTREQKEAARAQVAMKTLYRNESEDLARAESAWVLVREHVDAAMAALPARQREVMVLRYFEQHSLEAIAAHTNSGLETVRGRLKLARGKLEKLLRRKLGRSAAALLPASLLQGLEREAAGAVPAAIRASCSLASLKAVGPGSKVSAIVLETSRAMSLAGVKAAAPVAAGVAGAAAIAAVAAFGLLSDRADEAVSPARPAVVREAVMERGSESTEPTASAAPHGRADAGPESARHPAPGPAQIPAVSAPTPGVQGTQAAGHVVLFKDDFRKGLENWEKITFEEEVDYTQYTDAAVRDASVSGADPAGEAGSPHDADNATAFADEQGWIRIVDDEINGVPCKAVAMEGAGSMQVIGIRLRAPVWADMYTVSFDMKFETAGTTYVTPQAPVQREANTWYRWRYENTCTSDASGAAILVTHVYVDERFVAEVRSPCTFTVDIVQTAFGACRYANLAVTVPER